MVYIYSYLNGLQDQLITANGWTARQATGLAIKSWLAGKFVMIFYTGR
jgi:hypothetical protein